MSFGIYYENKEICNEEINITANRPCRVYFYWSPVSGVYSSSKDVGNVITVNIQSVAGSLKGNYCFVVTAYDTVGNESDYSNEVCSTFVLKKSAPRNLRIQ